jgi:hypothetical protein
VFRIFGVCVMGSNLPLTNAPPLPKLNTKPFHFLAGKIFSSSTYQPVGHFLDY